MESTPTSVNRATARQVYHSLVRYLGNTLRQALFRCLDPGCRFCDAPGAVFRDLCPACLDAAPVAPRGCPTCHSPSVAPGGLPCGRCLRRPPDFDAVWAPLDYRDPVDGLVQALKFGGDLTAARTLTDLMLHVDGPSRLPAALIPVPLHRGRLRERGFNQSVELGRHLGRRLGVPLLFALERTRATPPQSALDARRREANLRGAFAACRAVLPDHVAIVDDVMTTGGTVNRCARELRRVGVRRVDVWAAARA